MGSSGKRRRAHSVTACEDVLLNILSRLSPADLSRCKCVSDDWRRKLVPLTLALRPAITLAIHSNRPAFYSFSDDTAAVQRHHLYLPSPSSCVAAFDGPKDATRLLSGCNGMVVGCLGLPPDPRRSCCSFLYPDFTVTRYVLLNSVTGEVSSIRPPPETSSGAFTLLAFDSRVSSKRYKIISRNFRSIPYLYSSRTGMWQPLRFPDGKASESASLMRDFLKTDSYCFKGVAYKIAGDSADLPPGYHQKSIVAFNVEEESLSWIASPLLPYQNFSVSEEGHVMCTYCYLGECCGYLRYAYHVEGKSLSTWLYDGNWTYVHRINLEDAQHTLLRSPLRFASFHPLDGNVVFVDVKASGLFVADLEKLEFRQVAQKRHELSWGALYPYVTPR